MSRKQIKRRPRRQRKSIQKQKNLEKMRWMLTIDSKEAAVNFYSILIAFQTSKGHGYFNDEALKCIDKWLGVISKYDPDIEKRANDRRGPFREKDTSLFNISLELDHKERSLMLVIWKMMHSQLITPKMKENWIRNQGQEDYELALKNYETWLNTLEGDGYIPETA